MAYTRCFPYTPEFVTGLGAVDRPILPELVLIGPTGRRMRTQPYVDMGADFSVFPGGIARLLEAPWESGRELPISGLYGGGVGRLLPVRAVLLEKEFDLPALFVPEERVPLVLGRAGVLRHFRVEYRSDRFCIRRL